MMGHSVYWPHRTGRVADAPEGHAAIMRDLEKWAGRNFMQFNISFLVHFPSDRRVLLDQTHHPCVLFVPRFLSLLYLVTAGSGCLTRADGDMAEVGRWGWGGWAQLPFKGAHCDLGQQCPLNHFTALNPQTFSIRAHHRFGDHKFW